MKKREQLKILLLQVREDKETMIEEFYEFIQFSDLHEEQVDVLNAYQSLEFNNDLMRGYDALFIGGSSDASVLKLDEYQFISHCKQLVRYCYDHNIPVFASCFGFQVAVQELGGEVELDEENMEMGMYQIELTEEAKNCPLLYDYPDSFWAVSGHKERATNLPKHTILLASTPQCPYHIIRFENKPLYAFQFHPEVDRKDLIARITRYQERYLDNSSVLQTIIDTATHETTLSNKLLRNFIDRIVLKNTVAIENS